MTRSAAGFRTSVPISIAESEVAEFHFAESYSVKMRLHPFEIRSWKNLIISKLIQYSLKAKAFARVSYNVGKAQNYNS